MEETTDFMAKANKVKIIEMIVKECVQKSFPHFMLSSEKPLVLATKHPVLPSVAKLSMLELSMFELSMVTPKVSVTMPMRKMVGPV